MNKLFVLIFLLISLDLLAQGLTKPNIIWITCEDISPYKHAFGDNIVKTPHLDRLTNEGVKYNAVYTTAGVCAPSRSSIITGMYPTSIGTQHMRAELINQNFAPKDIPSYAAVIPYYVKAFPEFLRMEGYYTSNNMKEDYQFRTPVTVWDESSAAADYRNRDLNQPFFSVYNFFVTHESQIMKYPDTLSVKPEEVKLPAYYEDTPTARKDIANLLSHIELLDKQVGELITKLKKDGVYENSYIFFFSDHGGNLPWMKREILERGTHIPFVVKHPHGYHAGSEINDLVSAVDFAPTILSLASIKPPNYLQGRAFLGKYAKGKKRKYVFAARDRMDEKYDRVRAVRDKQFRYLYNYMPNQPKYQDIAYRRDIPLMREILERKQNKSITNKNLLDWFNATKPIEELYDVLNDPDEVHNLAADPKYIDKLTELRLAFRKWERKVGDLSAIPEKEMVIDHMWGGKTTAPTTGTPIIKKTDKGIVLRCPTKGASIGYRILEKGENANDKIVRTIHSWDIERYLRGKKNGNETEINRSWLIYKGEPISMKRGQRLLINAMRIGFKPVQIEYEYVN